ncbi:TerD family protein [Actinomadura harenae]|uniref:TerD family protein n=1 Tax=Actinomadura harenae TaxID=2483351 RepID=A0A3M2MC33_9ACTN|nr:TerD family protein [Actinomadura harenae]RMI47072.1 TerD family protein [Actinomadura harenae]
MAVPLTGGVGVPLPGSAPPALSVGFGWTPPGDPRADFDVDAAALMLDDAGAVLSEDHFVYFNNPRSPDGSVEHRGPAPDGPGEIIDVDLAAVPDRCARIAFPVSIFDAENREQRLGQVRAVRVRLSRRPDGAELARYDLPARRADDPATAVLLGELDRGAAGWTFRAVGRGYPGGLREIVHEHGLPVR